MKIGTDLVKICRIEERIKKYGYTFLRKVFSEHEIIDSYRYFSCKLQAAHFAKRFAAKEAYIKAAGFNSVNQMKNISVHNTSEGLPYFIINNNLVPHVKLSLSDDSDYALAFVVIITHA